MPTQLKKNRLILKSFFLLPCLFLVISCASPYLGRPVNLNHPSVCKFNEFPASCTYNSQHFIINYTIIKTGNPGEYKISGSAKSPVDSSKTWSNYSHATFTLYLVADGVIVETMTIAGGEGSLDKSITFAREFTSEHNFQATLINYQMDVRG